MSIIDNVFAVKRHYFARIRCCPDVSPQSVMRRIIERIST
jgi:hypothetical protein